MPVGLRVLKNLDIVLLICALPIFIGADLPILGWIGGSVGLRRPAARSASCSTAAPPRRTTLSGFLGVMVGGVIARGFLVALATLRHRHDRQRRRRVGRRPVPRRLHDLLHDDARSFGRTEEGDSQAVSRRLAFVSIGGVLLALTIGLFAIFGSEGQNHEFQPQNEFKLDDWIPIHIGSLDMSINKAVLYLCAGLRDHGRGDGLHRQADAGQAQPRADGGRGDLRPHLPQHHARQHGTTEMALKWFPFIGDALPLHPVLEPDRLHPVADQHAREVQHLRPRDSQASPSTRPRRTSRSRSCSRWSSGSATTSRASGPRASSPT